MSYIPAGGAMARHHVFSVSSFSKPIFPVFSFNDLDLSKVGFVLWWRHVVCGDQ